MLKAKYAGKCAHCGGAINIGDEISWSRQERGKIYHPPCNPRRKESPATPTAVAPAQADVLAELLRNLLAKSTPTATAEEEPDESDFEITPPPAPKATPKPKAEPKTVKLTNTSPWYVILAAVLPLVRRVLLIGPPSTGKSTTAMLTAGTKHRVTMTETTAREDLIGMFHLIDGATKFVDGCFTTAMRTGAAVLTDEIDRRSPECESLFFSLIDDKPHITLPTGELVEAEDGYKVLMTTNESIDTLPPAIQDRIEIIINANTPHPDALSAVAESAKSVVMGYYGGIPVPTIRLHPTVRRMRTFHTLLAGGIPQELAARLVFGKDGAKEVLSALTSAEGRK